MRQCESFFVSPMRPMRYIVAPINNDCVTLCVLYSHWRRGRTDKLRPIRWDTSRHTPAQYTTNRPKFGFGFGAEDSNLKCFGKFSFRPNFDLWLSSNIRFRPKKFRGFDGVRVPIVHTAV